MPRHEKYPDPSPPLQGGTARFPWLVVAFAVLTGVLLAVALWVLRAEALRAGEARASALSQVIVEQTSRTLQFVDARLQLASAQLAAEAEAGELDASVARQLLRAQLDQLPFVRAM